MNAHAAIQHTYLGVGLEDGAIHLARAPHAVGYKAACPRPVSSWQAHPNACLDVAWAPQGAYLFSSSTDTSVRVWDPWTGTPIASLSGHKGVVKRIAPHPLSPFVLATAGRDGTVRLWDTRLRDRESVPLSACDSPTAGWPPRDREAAGRTMFRPSPPSATLPDRRPGPLDPACVVDSALLAESSKRGLLLPVSAPRRSAPPLSLLRGAERHTATAAAWLPEGFTLLCAGSTDQSVRVLDCRKLRQDALDATPGRQRNRRVRPGPEMMRLAPPAAAIGRRRIGVSHLAVSPSGTLVAATYSNAKVALYHTLTLDPPVCLDSGPVRGTYYASSSFSCDGSYLATCAGDTAVRVFSVERSRVRTSPLTRLERPADPVAAVAWSPVDAGALFSASDDGAVTSWNLHPTRSAWERQCRRPRTGLVRQRAAMRVAPFVGLPDRPAFGHHHPADAAAATQTRPTGLAAGIPATAAAVSSGPSDSTNTHVDRTPPPSGSAAATPASGTAAVAATSAVAGWTSTATRPLGRVWSAALHSTPLSVSRVAARPRPSLQRQSRKRSAALIRRVGNP